MDTQIVEQYNRLSSTDTSRHPDIFNELYRRYTARTANRSEEQSTELASDTPPQPVSDTPQPASGSLPLLNFYEIRWKVCNAWTGVLKTDF
jgi:hypothetical protein